MSSFCVQMILFCVHVCVQPIRVYKAKEEEAYTWPENSQKGVSKQLYMRKRT